MAGNLERLARLFDQFGADNTLAARAGGSQEELYRLKGRFLPAGWRRSVVSDLELAALAHLPNQEISGLAITRARARLEKPSPVYTEKARELRVEGEVVLNVIFNADGTLKILGVKQGLGHGLDEAAIAAASKMKFKPARRDGKPVDYTATLRVVFRLA